MFEDVKDRLSYIESEAGVGRKVPVEETLEFMGLLYRELREEVGITREVDDMQLYLASISNITEYIKNTLNLNQGEIDKIKEDDLIKYTREKIDNLNKLKAVEDKLKELQIEKNAREESLRKLDDAQKKQEKLKEKLDSIGDISVDEVNALNKELQQEIKDKEDLLKKKESVIKQKAAAKEGVEEEIRKCAAAGEKIEKEKAALEEELEKLTKQNNMSKQHNESLQKKIEENKAAAEEYDKFREEMEANLKEIETEAKKSAAQIKIMHTTLQSIGNNDEWSKDENLPALRKQFRKIEYTIMGLFNEYKTIYNKIYKIANNSCNK